MDVYFYAALTVAIAAVFLVLKSRAARLVLIDTFRYPRTAAVIVRDSTTGEVHVEHLNGEQPAKTYA